MPLINFSGIASGIDSEALIQATSDAARAGQVTPKEDRISELVDTNDAIEGLATLLEELQDKADVFRTINGGALAKEAIASDETVATVSAANGSANTAFSLTVTQIAQSGTFSFNDRYASIGTAIAPALTSTGSPNDEVQVQVGTGTDQVSVSFTLTATTTVDSFISSINNSSLSSRLVASAVNVADPGSTPSYAIVLTGLNEGTQKGTIAVNVGSDITAASAFTASTENAAQDAQFSVSGVTGTITRSTNKVSDVFNGLTINLSKVGTTNITVGDDIDTTTATVQEYVDKYNEIVEYLHDNNLIQKESDQQDALNVFGPLARTRVDDNALSTLRAGLSSANYFDGIEIKVLADLGFATEQDGTIEFDTDAFGEALAKEPTAVDDMLNDIGHHNVALTADGGSLDQYIRFNGIFDLAVTGNKELIDRLNDSIARAEAAILKNEQTLRQRFARLESIVGNLQSQQASLSAAFASF